jgi:hypothetical protein
MVADRHSQDNEKRNNKNQGEHRQVSLIFSFSGLLGQSPFFSSSKCILHCPIFKKISHSNNQFL